MKISIVTLSFNQRAYLAHAIESVLAQQYEDLEYIVVDPGSTDGSRELIETYGDQIACKLFERDAGAADGLNKGFERATGEVFGFLNADDVLYPGALRTVADFFMMHPDCDVAMGNGYTIDERGQKLRHYRAQKFTVRRFFYGGTQFLQQATFFRAGTYHRSPKFNVENHTCWDGELFVSFANQGARIGYIAADLGGFRIHSQSISGSGRMSDEYLADCRRMFRQLRGHEWGAADELLRFMYRSVGALRRVLALVPQVRKGTA